MEVTPLRAVSLRRGQPHSACFNQVAMTTSAKGPSFSPQLLSGIQFYFFVHLFILFILNYALLFVTLLVHLTLHLMVVILLDTLLTI